MSCDRREIETYTGYPRAMRYRGQEIAPYSLRGRQGQHMRFYPDISNSLKKKMKEKYLKYSRQKIAFKCFDKYTFQTGNRSH